MTQRQKSRFRMLCRELAKLVKEVQREHSRARIVGNEAGVIHMLDDYQGRVLEAEAANPER